MRTDMNLTGKIAVQNFKRSLGAFLALLTVASTSVHALQIIDPRLSVAGASIAATTRVLPAGATFSFFGVYSDDSAITGTNVTGAESGLGLKVKYNGTHLTNVSITEEFTKCRIAVAQVPAAPTATDQVVMGWIDTAIRATGVAATANGSVGWPDLIDQASTGICLNPGNINTDTAAVAPTGLKLFKFTATMAPSCTSSGACTSTVELTSDGNFSYASATPGMTPKTFTIQGAPAPLCNLDVDGSGGVPTASVDGLLIKRALNPFIPAANILIGITLPGSAIRITGTDIRNYVLGLGNVLDVDTNGTAAPVASVDGLLIQRALNTFISSASVTTGVTTTATGAQVRTYLNTNCGTSLTP